MRDINTKKLPGVTIKPIIKPPQVINFLITLDASFL